MRAAIVCVAAICVAQAGLAADEPGKTQLMEMRARMGRTLKTLPNYVCLQTTERLRAPKAKAQAKARAVDTVQLEVAHVGDKEMYSWPGRNMFADSQLQNALPSGLVGTGAHASQVIDILFGPGTQFRWVGKETLGQRATLRWDFTVPKADSNWTVFKANRTSRVGSEGSIWADAGTLDLVRLEARATQFSARFPLKSVARSIDYANMRIGARDVLLPGMVEDLVEEASGPLDINRSSFGHCREYSTSSTLTFNEPAAQQAQAQSPVSSDALPPNAPVPPAPDAARNVQSQAALSALPPNTHILLGLDGHLRPENAVIGSAVNAHLLSDIRYKGKLLAPKGAPVHGVLQQYIKVNDGFVYSFTLTIDFNELELPGGTVPFHAWLKSIDTPVKGLWWLIPAEGNMMRSVHYSGPGGSEDDSLAEVVKLDPKPGVAVLLVRRQVSFHLFPGTRMTWITSDGVPEFMKNR
jgi:hypothetical protein